MAERKMNPEIASFPSNSNKSKSSLTTVPQTEKKKPQKVISGEVVEKKKSLGQRFSDSFIASDIKDIGHYLWYDLMVPFAKDMLVNIVTGGLEKLFYGEARPHNHSKNSYVSPYRTDYGQFYYNSLNKKQKPPEESRHISSLNEMIFRTRSDAEAVRDGLLLYTEEYGLVSVADLYDMVGKIGSYTDERIGWSELKPHEIGVRQTRDGFVLDLPRPTSIK